MVDMGTAMIVSGLFMMAGMFLFQSQSLRNYFKKENFKLQVSNIKAENRLKLKKLEREMGITTSKAKTETSEPSGLASILKPIISNLEPEQLAGLAEHFLPEGGGGGGGLQDMLMDFAAENPEMVQGFLEGLSNKGKDNSGGAAY